MTATESHPSPSLNRRRSSPLSPTHSSTTASFRACNLGNDRQHESQTTMKAKDSAAAAQFREVAGALGYTYQRDWWLISFLIVHAVSNVLVKGMGKLLEEKEDRCGDLERRRISLGAFAYSSLLCTANIVRIRCDGPISQRIAISRLHQVQIA